MAITTTLYLARHGQTEWNVEHRFQGRLDSPLTELGVRQAEWLRDAMAGVNLDLAYASPSPRASRTARIVVGAREMEIRECEAFMELNVGVWEGRTQDEAKSLDPLAYDRFWKDPDEFRVEEGETYAQAAERSVGKLEEILAAHAGSSILLVTHTVALKLIMAHFEKRPLHRLWDLPYIHPACLCVIEIEDGLPRIVLHGDISHYR